MESQRHIRMHQQGKFTVYDYTQIMFSAIMGLLVFGQLPDMLSFVGYCVIIAAGVIMFFIIRDVEEIR